MTASDPDHNQLARAEHARSTFWLSASSCWLPAHNGKQAWVTHAPFAFWLMDVLRPHSIVELGTHYGFSCFAFAEAVRRLGLDCRISALDNWEGDDQAGLATRMSSRTTRAGTAP